MDDTQNSDALEEKKKEVQLNTEDTNIDPTDEAGSSNNSNNNDDENLSEAQINWKKARQERDRIKIQSEEQEKIAKEAARKNEEKDAQINMLTQALEKIAIGRESGAISKTEEKQLIYDIMDDDIPTGGELKSYLKDFIPNAIKEILSKQNEEKENQKQKDSVDKIPDMLMKNHQDFEKVVNEENIFYLKYHYPEIEATISDLPHSYDKWSRVYGLIKKLVPESDKMASSVVDKNLNKPQNIQTAVDVRKSESSSGRRISDTEKAANYQRILALARSV